MNNISKITLIISVIILVVVIVVFAFFYFHRAPVPNFKIDYSKQYPESASDVSGFENKKTGSIFTVYYHPADEAKANKVLAILEQAGLPLYQKYLGFRPNDTHVFLTEDADEYIKISSFPGGKENLTVGYGSAPAGKLYLYKPLGGILSVSTQGIIHEGTHAALFQFLGRETYGNRLPSFLNEGLAYYLEYIYKAGPDFNPLKEIFSVPILTKSVKTGRPSLMGLEEMSLKCQGFIPKGDLDALCRAEGTFFVWHIGKNYGEKTLPEFLISLKQNLDWQKAINKTTGKTIAELDQEIQAELKIIVSK